MPSFLFEIEYATFHATDKTPSLIAIKFPIHPKSMYDHRIHIVHDGPIFSHMGQGVPNIPLDLTSWYSESVNVFMPMYVNAGKVGDYPSPLSFENPHCHDAFI